MKAFSGYDSTKESVKFEGLPRGGYELVIMGATPFKFVNQKPVDWSGNNIENPDVLEIYVDVADGVYKDYFAKNYKAQQTDDKKWRGVLKLYFPKDDGSDKDQWTKNTFARATNAIEDSNAGYHWDWNEKSLKGKIVGGLFNFREYEKQDGTVGKALSLACFIDIKKIRTGNYTVPEDKAIRQVTGQQPMNTGFLNIPDGVEEEGLPFK